MSTEKTESEKQFCCGICGAPVDEDIKYCSDCDEFSGQWVVIDENGEIKSEQE